MRICVVCGDVVCREGISGLLKAIPDVHVLRTNGSLAAAVRHLRKLSAVVVCSQSTEKDDLQQLDSLASASNISIITMTQLPEQPEALQNTRSWPIINRSEGLAGLKRALAQVPDIRPIRRRKGQQKRHPLTLSQREYDVARHISSGQSNRQIAASLGLSEQTVKNLCTVVMRKLKCENRVQVALHFSALPTTIA